ncbi:hypothetical protein H6G20_00130 [Desertifilum sp. FACHB-1129]|uniref:Uncharacterized protein n=2 Tax=Desertifilum tharense IPPAS B-1220 TaxID=1781255 RepID=A0A1E5QK98_9CYAN|nr:MULTISPECIES: hypothetical protein [Desertifilum]MDA0211564.1 hypothetical protein [Cyanobacteria bacterium FC1]MBD2310088.1 hypothetical protein [Desertifilum sp. FACHB-1129]MBD2322108.1 hypothetical protein [Desertifilum sp. FACHB-866]MBD2333813.1 hypothetical protein [Desertifilum sp. FACHB-868]OEJ74773.1 hypothetical protein BH720_12915 [Desertifilum tharense IPPAS B-1220]
MLRFILIALVTIELVLLSGFLPAKASSPSQAMATYTWGYPYVGSTQLVCKQIEAKPTDSAVPQKDKQQIKMQSTLVSDRFCSHLAKPSTF